MMPSFQFARTLAVGMRGAKVVLSPRIPSLELAHYRVTGKLDIGSEYAEVEVWVWQDFYRLRRMPPLVRCHEPWMRSDPDWHNDSQTGMCWILADLWRDGMGWEGKSPRAVVEEGSRWLFADVRCLANRHLTGWHEKLAQWPSEWKAWRHYDAGSRDYRRDSH